MIVTQDQRPSVATTTSRRAGVSVVHMIEGRTMLIKPLRVVKIEDFVDVEVHVLRDESLESTEPAYAVFSPLGRRYFFTRVGVADYLDDWPRLFELARPIAEGSALYKTHCKRGHPLTPDNLRTPCKGRKRGRCRKCSLERDKAIYRRKRVGGVVAQQNAA